LRIRLHGRELWTHNGGRYQQIATIEHVAPPVS
jgi:hypothetical protein